MKKLVKYRTISLKEHDMVAIAVDIIKRMEGVIDCRYAPNNLYIEYDLNYCNYQLLCQQLEQQGLFDTQTKMMRLRLLLYSFIEQNERNYAKNPGGLDHYLKALYLSCD